MDVRVMLGHGNADPEPDEIILDAPDGYAELPFKTAKGCQWALDHGYSHLFKCDTDTYVIFPRLLSVIPPPDVHCAGCRHNNLFPHGHMGGGGYWLDRVAFEIIANTPPVDGATGMPYEDAWATATLAKRGIFAAYDDRRYRARLHPRDPDGLWEGTVAATLGHGTDKFDPADMYACHKKFMEFASAGDLISKVLPPLPSPLPTPHDKELQRKYEQQGATGWAPSSSSPLPPPRINQRGAWEREMQRRGLKA
jgi:hypothetical protein